MGNTDERAELEAKSYADLQKICKDKGLKQTGNAKALIDRIVASNFDKAQAIAEAQIEEEEKEKNAKIEADKNQAEMKAQSEKAVKAGTVEKGFPKEFKTEGAKNMQFGSGNPKRRFANGIYIANNQADVDVLEKTLDFKAGLIKEVK